MCSVGPAPYPHAFEEIEEALRHSVAVTVAATAHWSLKVVLLQEGCPVHAGELGALDALLRDKRRFGLVDLFVSAHDGVKDFAGDIAVEVANGLQLGMIGRDALGDIVLRTWIQPQAPDGDDVDHAVGRAITAPLFNLCRTVFPDEAGTELTPHTAGKLASDLSRSGLCSAVSNNCAALFRPMALRASSFGARSLMMASIMSSRLATSSYSSR